MCDAILSAGGDIVDAITETIRNMVSVTDFNKGAAGSIFDSVKQTGVPKLVLKRNEPTCVLVAPKAYINMVEELEDLRDYKLAMERLVASDASPLVSWAQILEETGVSQDELDEMEDVELE